jgi:SAM-dependent MidA family methyltransferase
MERALYEPRLGYYAATHERPTRAGDFLTAPELHPIFGKAVARQVEEMWQRVGKPAAFVVREYGAGRGVLGRALRDGFRYEPIEAADRRPTVPVVGVILANEFLDALPVHRVVVREGRLKEIKVGWSEGRLVESVGQLSDDRLAAWFDDRNIRLAEEQRAEVNLAMGAWLGELAGTLERGYVVIIDYGLPAAELYGAARRTGTLRAFRSHHVSSGLLAGVGHQDLTAHIDLDALEASAREQGFDILGRTSQAEFLVGCGLQELLEAERKEAGEDWSAQLLLRSSVGRLLDPRQLGGYAVVVLARGVSTDPPLRGLSFKLAPRSAA